VLLYGVWVLGYVEQLLVLVCVALVLLWLVRQLASRSMALAGCICSAVVGCVDLGTCMRVVAAYESMCRRFGRGVWQRLVFRCILLPLETSATEFGAGCVCITSDFKL
jgi:hypothetical protein